MYTVLKTRPVLLSRDRVKQVAGQPCVVDAIKKLDFRQKQSQRSRCHFLYYGCTVYHCISVKKETVSLHATRLRYTLCIYFYMPRVNHLDKGDYCTPASFCASSSSPSRFLGSFISIRRQINEQRVTVQ